MKFTVERTFIVRTTENIDLDPKDFLQCANIDELIEEIEDCIYSCTVHPTHPGFESSEEVGTQYWNDWYNEQERKSFYVEWQKLKGLPEEL